MNHHQPTLLETAFPSGIHLKENGPKPITRVQCGLVGAMVSRDRRIKVPSEVFPDYSEGLSPSICSGDHNRLMMMMMMMMMMMIIPIYR
jgi:hypothetical protein